MADSISAIGLRGVQKALESAADNAQKVSEAFSEKGGGEGQFLDGAIGLKQDELQLKASSKVTKVGEEMNDSILDILA